MVDEMVGLWYIENENTRFNTNIYKRCLNLTIDFPNRLFPFAGFFGVFTKCGVSGTAYPDKAESRFAASAL